MSRYAILTRETSGDAGTFGTVRAWNGSNSLALFTGELPDRGNSSGLSRINAGKYRAIYTESPAFHFSTYEILNVPQRSGIRWHVANFFGDRLKGLRADVLGCTGLGEARGTLLGQAALLRSITAVRRFEEFMQYQPFDLEIIDHA
jgi:hypothetical protein